MKNISLVVALSLLTAIAAGGQTGRAGAGWQTDINLAKEEQAKFVSQIQNMPVDEWQARSLAWLSFELTDSELSLTQLRYVIDAVGDKKAITEKADEEDLWTVRFAKKPPRTVTLTLTDPDATEVKCFVKDLEPVGHGYIGIFQHEHELLCIPREPGASSG